MKKTGKNIKNVNNGINAMKKKKKIDNSDEEAEMVHNSSVSGSGDEAVFNKKMNNQKDAMKKDKQNNTIMQQINNFSLTPMNDALAEQTIEDHKYLLELVENRCAIAFYACSNRNQSLFNALVSFINEAAIRKEVEELGEQEHQKNVEKIESPLEAIFNKMIEEYDFLSVVMYPDLKNRREFIHDCWLIAKATENDELKMSIYRDPYFYLNREDLLNLLKTHDDTMITHILELKCNHHIKGDVGYKLVSIKNEQVDKNQHTPCGLLDFVSVLIMNKRDSAGNVLFSHNYVLNFLEKHSKFVKDHEILKILILAGKFRLSLEFINKRKIEFEIEFFTNAIEANAYDIAFYLLRVYEEQIFQNSQRAIDFHVKSYQNNRQFLKSKLHMSKMLLIIFNFNSAKIFLEIIQNQIENDNLDGNLFSHSCNPLLNMCLLYELLLNIIKKFFSLNNICRTIMKTTMNMAIAYIESVDDENFLTAVMLERDFSGRDAMRIAVELELLDLI